MLREGEYTALSPNPDGTLRSTIFPGLCLDPATLISGNLYAFLATVQRGTATPTHAELVAALEAARIR